ncbi:tail fiber domain-containing protein [Candidatus Bathyarchaeota archaeon]|nr:tail fiber domain-containing protein [Candidatus Bathyarchaeota archaeon]
MSSINNFFDVVPFSISGLQDLAVDTINGNSVFTTINIAGQTAYLSWDSTTSTLTLLIPTANGVVAGLLSATDWTTFNGKENLLTFTSPLTRVGNTISFDFTQSLTFNGNTQTLNNNTIVGGGMFYTGATSNTTGFILYIDNFTGYITKGAVPPSTNLLPLNNLWTGTNLFGATTTFEGQVNTRLLRIENLNDVVGNIVQIFTNSFVNDYWFFNNLGGFGFVDNVDGLKWLINKDGTSSFFGFMGVNGIQVNNSFLSMNNSPIYLNDNRMNVRTGAHPNGGYISYSASNVSGSTQTTAITGTNGIDIGYLNAGFYKPLITATQSLPLRVWGNHATEPNTHITYNTINDLVGTYQGAVEWYISARGIAFVDRVETTGKLNIPSAMKTSEFSVIPAFNNWIASTHSVGAINNGLIGDKIVIGNIYPADPNYGATIGAHNYALNQWRTLYVNLGGTTIMPTLIVSVSFTPPSDRRLKDDIRYLDSGKSIDFIKKLKPCIYRRVDKRNIPNFQEPEPKLQHGFIADEIEEIAVTEAQKNLVDTFEFNGYKDCRKLAILNLIPEIVQANKEMIDKIETLEADNTLLKQDNTLLKQENDRIKQDYNLFLERISLIEQKLVKNRTILKY